MFGSFKILHSQCFLKHVHKGNLIHFLAFKLQWVFLTSLNFKTSMSFFDFAEFQPGVARKANSCGQAGSVVNYLRRKRIAHLLTSCIFTWAFCLHSAPARLCVFLQQSLFILMTLKKLFQQFPYFNDGLDSHCLRIELYWFIPIAMRNVRLRQWSILPYSR